MTKLFPIVFLILLISCTSKKEKKGSQKAKKPVIAVVNYPLYYLAKTIGGEHLTVYFPAIDGDPAHWKPSAKQIINFQKADLIIANGAGYAKWMKKVSLPSSRIVNTSASFEDQWIETKEGLSHSHGGEGQHVHKGTAFTTWLNFELAEKQAESVFEALNNLIPSRTKEFAQNFKQLQANLNELDKRMEWIAKQINKQPLICSHPVYQYLEEAYGLVIISQHWVPNKMPDVDQWEDLKHNINEHQARIMIWEDEPMNEILLKLDELKVSIVVFNPCANTPEEGDFLDMMKENLSQLEKAIDAK